VDKPRPPTRPLRPWLGPAISLILLALLAAITLSLPENQIRGGYSIAGALMRSHILRPMQVGRRSAVDLWFVKEGDKLALHDPDDESWDFVSRTLASDPGNALRIHYRPEIVRSGFWAITHQVDHHRLEFQFGSNFSEQEKAEARTRFLAFAAPTLPWVPDDVFAALGRDEPINRPTILYWGYALDVLTLLLAAAFVLSLRWVAWIPAQIRALRARHALACGRCPTCGYPLASLTTPICPECGSAFPHPSTQSVVPVRS
jgi:hypothetical protein